MCNFLIKLAVFEYLVYLLNLGKQYRYCFMIQVQGFLEFFKYKQNWMTVQSSVAVLCKPFQKGFFSWIEKKIALSCDQKSRSNLMKSKSLPFLDFQKLHKLLCNCPTGCPIWNSIILYRDAVSWVPGCPQFSKIVI